METESSFQALSELIERGSQLRASWKKVETLGGLVKDRTYLSQPSPRAPLPQSNQRAWWTSPTRGDPDSLLRLPTVSCMNTQIFSLSKLGLVQLLNHKHSHKSRNFSSKGTDPAAVEISELKPP